MCRWKFITMVVKKHFDLLCIYRTTNCVGLSKNWRRKNDGIQTKNELFTCCTQLCILKFTNYYITRWQRIQKNIVDNKIKSKCVYGSVLSTFCANNEEMNRSERKKKKIGKSVIAFICLKRWEHDSPAANKI